MASHRRISEHSRMNDQSETRKESDDSRCGVDVSSRPLSENEYDSHAQMYRELRGLRFENPGSAVALAEISLMTKPNSEGRRRSTRQRKQVCASQYSPHHDENGDFVKQDGTKVKLCDCLRESCPGCHPQCKHCDSRMCGPACQKGRDFVLLKIGCECDPSSLRYHPFLEKHKQCYSSCYPFAT